MHLADSIERQRRWLAANGARTFMLWAYYDETEVLDKSEDGKQRFRDMLVGGCVSTKPRWDRFGQQWRDILAAEGVECFHGNEFYSYSGRFAWFTLDGERDEARHLAFRAKLVAAILDNVEAISAYCGPRHEAKQPVVDAYKRCVEHVFTDFSRTYPEKNSVSIVLARRTKPSPWTLLSVFENHNFDGRLAGCGVFRPEDVIELQAADFVMHALNSRWRSEPNSAYEALKAGAKLRGVHITVSLRGTFHLFDSWRSALKSD